MTADRETSDFRPHIGRRLVKRILTLFSMAAATDPCGRLLWYFVNDTSGDRLRLLPIKYTRNRLLHKWAEDSNHIG